MNILAIDTATEKMSVALLVADGAQNDGRGDTWFFGIDAGMRHGELVMECADALLRKAGIEPRDLGGVTCMEGPGSFTGLRIGFSTAKGLALALGIPFAPIPTLDCLARPLSFWPGLAVPVLDAKQNAFFCALFRGGRRLAPDMDAPAEDVAKAIAAEEPREPILLFGPGARLLFGKGGFREGLGSAPAVLGEGVAWGNAATLLEMARPVFAAGDSAALDANLLSGPRYIRRSDAEINLGNKIPASDP